MSLRDLLLSLLVVVFLLGFMAVFEVQGLTLGTAWARVQFLKRKVRIFILIAKTNGSFTN